MNVVSEHDLPPAGHELGGIQPAIHSLAELETAVETIAHIESRRRTVLAAYQQSLALIEAHRDEQLRIDVDGRQVTLDDREDALREAVADYVTAHRADVFDQGTQTRHFARGSVSLTKCKPRIDYTDGQTKSLVAGRLIKRYGLVAKLTAFASRIKIEPFLRLKAELDVAGIKKAFEQGQLKRPVLTRNGLRYVDDEEAVAVKTDNPSGRSHTPDPQS